jgi:uncharacterized glyoxalase superfamily protein PhnB
MLMNRSAAPGPVVPVLVYEDVGAAIDWLFETFGFAERFRYGPDGRPEGAQLAVRERQYTVEDLGGHRWTFSQSTADFSPEEWGGQSAGPR